MKKKWWIWIGALVVMVLVAVPASSIYYDSRVTNLLLKGVIEAFEQATTPGSAASNYLRTFVSDESTVSTWWTKDSGGVAKNLSRRSIYLPLIDAFINNSGDPMGKDATTAPGLALTDGIPAIVYANSTENQWISWTFRLPDDFVAGLKFRILASYSATTGATTSPPVIQWGVIINSDDVAYITASQDSGSVTMESTGAVSNTVLEWALNTAGSTLLGQGRFVTLQLRNRAYGLNTTTEIKSVQALYN